MVGFRRRRDFEAAVMDGNSLDSSFSFFFSHTRSHAPRHHSWWYIDMIPLASLGAHEVWTHHNYYEEGINDVHYDRHGRPIPTGIFYAASKGKAKMVKDRWFNQIFTIWQDITISQDY